jgi:hypothetical protein
MPTTVRLTVLALALACSRKPTVNGDVSASAASDPASLRPGAFRITETSATPDGGTRYLAQTSATCSFDIVFARPQTPADSPFGIARATLARRTGADCSPFLRALAPTLGFKGALPNPSPAAALVASVAILGVHQSRSHEAPEAGGGFSSNPPGSWTVTKLFLNDGEGELFLNVNAAEGIGELSPKDEGYANVVVRELAKILLLNGG